MEIRRLRIERFRGLEELEWTPHPALNCLIGPGDAGKSTILDAIALLLSPRGLSLSEYDYHARQTERGFVIEAVLGDLGGLLADLGSPVIRGWQDGELKPFPEENDEPVLVARLVGGPDLDARHELLRTDDQPEPFRAHLRSAMGLTTIDTTARAASELRLARGTLLSRHIEQAEVRSELAVQLGRLSDRLTLPNETAEALVTIGEAFNAAGLPREVALGLLSQAGGSLLGLLALHTTDEAGVSLPVAASGAGSQQTALFALASALARSHRTLIIDEPETGLEPYRQRDRVGKLRELVLGHGQAFLSTHSPAVLSSLRVGELWRMAPGSSPVDLSPPELEKLLQHDPEALLARRPVVCEGLTEVGLLDEILPFLANESGRPSPWVAGLHLVDGKGQEHALNIARHLARARVAHGVFVDNEATSTGNRAAVIADPLCIGATWITRRNIEEVCAVNLAADRLESLFTAAATLGKRTESLREQVGAEIGTRGRQPVDELLVLHGEARVREALAAVMDREAWFKSRAGGRALAKVLIEAGLPGEIGEVLRDLHNRLNPPGGGASQPRDGHGGG
jgi:putative ATP-dependent endonuclease of OLD family